MKINLVFGLNIQLKPISLIFGKKSSKDFNDLQKAFETIDLDLLFGKTIRYWLPVSHHQSAQILTFLQSFRVNIENSYVTPADILSRALRQHS